MVLNSWAYCAEHVIHGIQLTGDMSELEKSFKQDKFLKKSTVAKISHSTYNIGSHTYIQLNHGLGSKLIFLHKKVNRMSHKHLKIRRHARHSSENRPTIIGCPTSTQNRMFHKHLKIRSHKRHPNENLVMNILKYALQYHQN